MFHVPSVGEAFPAPSARSKSLPQSWWGLVPESPKMGISPSFSLLHFPSLVVFGELIHSEHQNKALCTKDFQVRTEGGFGVTLKPLQQL